MRPLALALLLLLAACASDAPSPTSGGSSEPAGSDAGGELTPDTPAAAELDVAAGSPTEPVGASDGVPLGEALVGGWALVVGPGETADFRDDGTYGLFAHSRPMGEGAWRTAGDTLFLDADAYVLAGRQPGRLAFAGGPDGELVIDRID